MTDNKDLFSSLHDLLDKNNEQLTKGVYGKLFNDLINVQNRIFCQLESLIWLQRQLSIKGSLPPLRGWATSPDVLLKLHTHIINEKPKKIVEFGSGASTIVIADALRQNGIGKLYSIEHSNYYGAITLKNLRAERLHSFVDLRIDDLELWEGNHLNPKNSDKPSKWYSSSLLKELEGIDLIWVDGPPGATCPYSRYPALPTLSKKLLPHAEVWMDDTNRQEEKDICEKWAEDYGFELEYFSLEKGLGRLTRPNVNRYIESDAESVIDISGAHPERTIGLDFSLPEKKY